MRKLTEEKKEILKYGICMGVVLFYRKCNLHRTPKRQGICRNNHAVLWAILFGYAAAGVLFFTFYIVKEPKEDGLWKYCLKGTAGVYTIMNFMPLFFLAGVALADRTPVRMIFLLDAVVIGGFLIWDYRRVWIMSKKLNKKVGKNESSSCGPRGGSEDSR